MCSLSEWRSSYRGPPARSRCPRRPRRCRWCRRSPRHRQSHRRPLVRRCPDHRQPARPQRTRSARPDRAGQRPPGALGAPTGLVGLNRTTVLGQNPVPSAPGKGRAGDLAEPEPVQQCLRVGAERSASRAWAGPAVRRGARPRERGRLTPRMVPSVHRPVPRRPILKGGLLGQMPQEQLG